MKKIIMVGIMSTLVCSTTYGRTKCNYHSQQIITGPVVQYTNSVMSDQERCEAEANYMAANHISGHVWGCIGNFEGVGVGNSPNCNTCTPSHNMTLTGDASCCDNNGRWYRVRSWR